jgi:hypothetical protein
MEQMNFHKQKLYSLIIAGVALVSLLLPWFTVRAGGFGGVSKNGLGGWGLLALLGVIAVVVACFMGNKTQPFDDMYKKVAVGGFAAIAGGAVIYLIRILTVGGGAYGGYVKASPGFGLIIGLLAGLAGLGFLMGMIKIPDNKKPPM